MLSCDPRLNVCENGEKWKGFLDSRGEVEVVNGPSLAMDGQIQRGVHVVSALAGGSLYRFAVVRNHDCYVDHAFLLIVVSDVCAYMPPQSAR